MSTFLSTASSVLAPFAIGFAALSFLPGWKSFVAGLFIVAAATLFLFFAMPGADGPGGALGLAILFIVLLGMFSALIGNGFVLAGKAHKWKFASRWVVLPVVFVLGSTAPPAWLQIAEEARKARYAPLSKACLEHLYPATLGSVDLELPLAPMIRIGKGFEFAPSYSFKNNEDARKFCRDGKTSPQVLTNLHVALRSQGGYTSDSRKSGFCAGEQLSPWLRAACETPPHGAIAGYPQEMTIYVIDRYDAYRMHAISAEVPAYYRQEMERMSPRALADGVVEYAGQYRRYYTWPSRPESVASCHISANGGVKPLYCRTGHPLTSELGLIFDFVASEDSFAEDVDAADRGAHEIFESLRKH